MGFASQLDDDRSPPSAIYIAGQAMREFNHRSFERLTTGKIGWQYPSDAYRALGELSYLAGRLPQAFQQITRALRHQLEAGQIGIDAGTTWAGNPECAVGAARVALECASQAAQRMYEGIAEAQNAISGAHYTGYVDDDEN
jgi:hypothetical protein